MPRPLPAPPADVSSRPRHAGPGKTFPCSLPSPRCWAWASPPRPRSLPGRPEFSPHPSARSPLARCLTTRSPTPALLPRTHHRAHSPTRPVHHACPLTASWKSQSRPLVHTHSLVRPLPHPLISSFALTSVQSAGCRLEVTHILAGRRPHLRASETFPDLEAGGDQGAASNPAVPKPGVGALQKKVHAAREGTPGWAKSLS